MNADFWRGRRVFLTGHTGFKGSWLSLWLQMLGAEVTGYALAPATDPNLFELAGVAEGMNSIIGDIRAPDELASALAVAAPEIVIHMAAQPLVRASYENPVETYSTNVMGTVHLLEAARQVGSVRSVLNVTTDKCYKNKEWHWSYREVDPLGGYDPYSNSKACSELVTSSFRDSFFHPTRYAEHGVSIATARAGNVIGGGDWARDRLVPDIFASLVAGRVPMIRNPNAIRPWQHVLEPIRGYLELSERLYTDGLDFSGPWNFGPRQGDEKPVSWISNQICRMWGSGYHFEQDKGTNPHEAGCLKLDISKAEAKLKWRPALKVEQAIELCVQWHHAVEDGCDPRDLTLTQIREYQENL